MKRPRTITAAARVQELVREHGSLRKAGAAVGVHFTALGGILRGEHYPNESTMAKLKLSGPPTYKSL